MLRRTGAMVALCALSLTACGGVQVGGGKGGPVTGSAGPAGSHGSVELNRCPGTARVTVSITTEQQAYMLIQFGLPGNPLPAMRLIAQQSNCVRIVNRDAGLQAGQTERALAAQGQLRRGANFGQGQIIAADYTILVEVMVNNSNAGGMGAGAILGMVPFAGPFLAMGAAGMRSQEAQVLLTLIDTRSSEQIMTATGKASGTSWSLGGGAGGFGGGIAGLGGAGGWESTDQGKVVMGAMIDAFNQLEPHMLHRT